ncbi:ABC transporter substrate-binding protein [Enterovirga sp. CN4-39]|uniref:ABC transporter substrate-binding protein n=1 Tax=Enterovirga sp. CN4-39 TaxID=3400910 RepID=UPI003C085A54
MRKSSMVAIWAASLALGMQLAAAKADVKFGALYPLSGELALLGEESLRGVELAVEEINAAGGMKGEKITLVKGDAVDNNQAIGETRRLISVERVAAIFGTFSSARSMAATQVAELSGVPYFELIAVSDDITSRGFKYVFRANPSSREFGAAAARAVSELVAPAIGADPKTLRVAIIHEDSAFGSSVSKGQVAVAKELGLNVVATMPYSAGVVDMSSIILRLQSEKVDVVLQTSYEKDTVLFLQQSKEIGFKPKAVIGAGGGYLLQPVADAVGHKVIQGALVVAEAHYDINPAAAPGLGAFVEAYKKKYGAAPRSGHSLINYAGAKAILEALGKAPFLKADDIRQAVMALDLPSGASAVGWGFKFDPNGQNQRAQMLAMQWQDGKLVTVFPKAAAVGQIVGPTK